MTATKGVEPKTRNDARAREAARAERSDLPDKILGWLRRHREDDGHSPSAIGKAIGRSSGAVTYALGYLVADGKVEQTNAKPKRYRAVQRKSKAA